MEKIYDESQQQKRQQQQKKKIKIDGVTMLSFAVALFAVVSLVAAGVSGFSFALPNTVVDLPTTFEGKESDTIEMGDYATNQSVWYHYYESGSTRIPLICLQRNIDFTPGNFTKVNDSSSVASEDTGLLYLLANLPPNASLTYPTDNPSGTRYNAPASGKEEYADFWVTQMAVWYYLGTKTNPDSTNTGEANIAAAKDASWVYIGDDFASFKSTNPGNTCDSLGSCFGFYNNDQKLFDKIKAANGKTINELVAEAKNKTGIPFSISLSDGEGTITTDENKEYYFSPKYTVVSSIDNTMGELTSYKLTITATDSDGETVDVGAVVTDSEGNIKNDLNNINPSELSTFLVRIPVNKVTKNVTVHVGILGTFRMYDGARYKVAGAGESQEVTTVKFTNKSTPAGKDFDLAPAPDTGISAGQTIYFIGLIVLLCGVGIIYANAKPAKAQAQN